MSAAKDRLVGELYGALRRLAAPPEEQVAYLKKLGVAPSADELALELDDLLYLVPQLVRDGRLDDEGAEAIYDLDRKLADMSGPAKANLWTVEALLDGEQWLDVRRLAKQALARAERGQVA